MKWILVLTLQQIVLSKNAEGANTRADRVLTLQQIVLSKNFLKFLNRHLMVLTLQQIVLSKNFIVRQLDADRGFDFTTNCSF